MDDVLEQEEDCFRYSFRAMASPCEVRVETAVDSVARDAGATAADEARRVEHKFSRYRADSVITALNNSCGQPSAVDDETADLLDFAAHCFTISNGLFDVTSGILRLVWKFDGSGEVPDAKTLRDIRSHIGWNKVQWSRPTIAVPEGMEIDFGGIGKEYAVDRAVDRIRERISAPVLVNFGGDLRVSGPREQGRRWRIAIEATEKMGTAAGILEINQGALATSGYTKRFIVHKGVRYSHILNPKTARPVANPPRSVTVAAATCLEAGMIATLAMLHGIKAEAFLRQEQVRAWCIR